MWEWYRSTGKVDEQKNQQKLSKEVGPLGHYGIQYSCITFHILMNFIIFILVKAKYLRVSFSSSLIILYIFFKGNAK